MTRRPTLLAIAALATATLVAPVERALRAQGAAIRADSVATVLARIPAGRVVRVGAGELVMEGTLRQPTGSLVRVAIASGEEGSVATSAVDRIWVQEGRSTAAGTKVGAIGGAVIGFALGYLAGSLFCEANCTSRQLRTAVPGAIGGGAVGGLLGAAFGAAGLRWRPVYP